jgi:hypothetical protein
MNRIVCHVDLLFSSKTIEIGCFSHNSTFPPPPLSWFDGKKRGYRTLRTRDLWYTFASKYSTYFRSEHLDDAAQILSRYVEMFKDNNKGTLIGAFILSICVAEPISQPAAVLFSIFCCIVTVLQ